MFTVSSTQCTVLCGVDVHDFANWYAIIPPDKLQHGLLNDREASQLQHYQEYWDHKVHEEHPR